MDGFKGAVAVATITMGLLGFSSSASASSFCVPSFFDGCPDNGTNQALATLQLALNTNGADGVADTVKVAPGTYSQATPFTASGSDSLTVTGAGRDQTFLTSTSNTGTQVVNVFSNARKITMRDLSIVLPPSFPNSGNTGSALLQSDDVFERVDVISKNDGSNGIVGITQGGTFRDVNLRVEAGGSFGYAFGHPTTIDVCSQSPKKLIAEEVSIENADSGITANCPMVSTSVRDLRIKSTDYAVVASDGNRMNIENALIESGDGAPVRALSGSNYGDTELSLSHATVVATGDETDPGILASVYGTGDYDDVRVTVRDSVISGFANPWEAKAPTGPTKGNTIVSISFSNYPAPGVSEGEAFVTEGDGIDHSAPQFVAAGDYRPAAGSPLIDAGQPTINSSEIDLAGNPRPVDGNGDGIAIADIGAFEYQPPPACATDPALCPKDTVKPKISKVKFAFKSGKGGALRMRISEAARINVTLRPRSKKHKVVKLSKRVAKAGPVIFEFGKNRLKPGRYRLIIQATDKSGNKSKLTRSVNAKRGPVSAGGGS